MSDDMNVSVCTPPELAEADLMEPSTPPKVQMRDPSLAFGGGMASLKLIAIDAVDDCAWEFDDI